MLPTLALLGTVMVLSLDTISCYEGTLNTGKAWVLRIFFSRCSSKRNSVHSSSFLRPLGPRSFGYKTEIYSPHHGKSKQYFYSNGGGGGGGYHKPLGHSSYDSDHSYKRHSSYYSPTKSYNFDGDSYGHSYKKPYYPKKYDHYEPKKYHHYEPKKEVVYIKEVVKEVARPPPPPPKKEEEKESLKFQIEIPTMKKFDFFDKEEKKKEEPPPAPRRQYGYGGYGEPPSPKKEEEEEKKEFEIKIPKIDIEKMFKKEAGGGGEGEEGIKMDEMGGGGGGDGGETGGLMGEMVEGMLKKR